MHFLYCVLVHSIFPQAIPIITLDLLWPTANSLNILHSPLAKFTIIVNNTH